MQKITVMPDTSININVGNEKEPTVSTDFIIIMMKVLSRAGFDPEEIFKAAGFDSQMLEDPGNRIPFGKHIAILDETIKKSSDPGIVLRMGEHIFDFTGHVLFSIMINSPTLGEAMENFCRYYNLLNNIIIPTFSVKEESAILELKFFSSEMSYYWLIADGLLAYWFTLFSFLTEGDLALDKVHFSHSRPSDINEYRRIFKSTILFGQTENGLIFNKRHLDYPIFNSNPDLLSTLEGYAKELQQKIHRTDTFTSRVEKTIMELFPSGMLDINQAASKLSMSKRKLQYKLSEEGATYQVLLDKTKKKQAEYLLEQPDISIIEIAFVLGYSEQSTFNRAFKKWTGFTPGKYRLKRLA